MTIAFQFAVLGLGTSAVYAMMALGLVAIHRASGVLNLGHGALAMAGGYLFWQLHAGQGVPTWPTFAIVLVGIGGISAAFYFSGVRPLRHASSLARVVITLGLLLFLQGLAQVIWGTDGKNVDPLLPTNTFTVGGVIVPVDRVWMIGIVTAITALLWASDRYTRFGMAIRATGQNARIVASLGWSPDLLAGVAWFFGGSLAAAAGMFDAPLIGLDTTTLPLLIVNVVAAALVGGFTSYPLTLLGALALGIAQSEVAYYVHAPGIIWALPFGLIVVLIAVRGKSLPVRGFFVERLPAVGTGRIRYPVVAGAVLIASILMITVFSASLLDSLTVSLAWATIMLSVVVLLGYTTQLSFEQMAMAGLASVIAAHLITNAGFPFELAFVVAILGAVPIGALFALPALRARGVNLAVITLGLGAAISYMIFNSATFAGGNDGIAVGQQSLFGFNIDADRFPERYAIVVMLCFTACALAVANVRRGRAGSALIAVRTNERAAAALGISVFHTKLFAFVMGSALAAVGGMMFSFRNVVIPFQDAYAPFQSVLAVAFAVSGGVGFIAGPLFGATFATGGFATWVIGLLWANPKTWWLSLAGGLIVMLVVNLHPDGMVELQLRLWGGVGRRLRRALHRPSPTTVPLPAAGPQRATPRKLEVRDLTVKYGNVTAVDGLTLSVSPGEVVGLIGPNGAGKTTVIDAISGFTRAAGGSVLLDGEQIDRLAVHERVQRGLSRSFQSLELFEQSTVRENLRVASDRHSVLGYGRDILAPAHMPLSNAAVAAVAEFGIEAELDRNASDLSYGHRRLVAIARAIAVNPGVLLLDEPAAGLASAESSHLGAVVRSLAEKWGMAVLVIEHDMALVMSICHRVVVLDFGTKIAEGPPESIRHDPAVIAAYLGQPEEDAAGRPGAPSLTPQITTS